MKLSGKFITVPLARKIVGMRGHDISSFNSCVGGKLIGTHGNVAERRHNFAAAATACKGK